MSEPKFTPGPWEVRTVCSGAKPGEYDPAGLGWEVDGPPRDYNVDARSVDRAMLGFAPCLEQRKRWPAISR